MKNTRYYDIQKIEEGMANGDISRDRGRALIEEIYSQSQNSSLEEKRRKMIENQRRLSEMNINLRKNPAKLTNSQQRNAVKYFIAHPEEF